MSTPPPSPDNPDLPTRARASSAMAPLPQRPEHPNPVVEMVLQNLEAGLPLAIAAPRAGVDPHSVRRWAQRDPELATMIRMLEGDRRAKTWEGLDKAGEHWRREAWKLEKTVAEFRDKPDLSAAVQRALLQLLDQLEPLMPKQSYRDMLEAIDELDRLDSGSVVAAPEEVGAGKGG